MIIMLPLLTDFFKIGPPWVGLIIMLCAYKAWLLFGVAQIINRLVTHFGLLIQLHVIMHIEFT